MPPELIARHIEPTRRFLAARGLDDTVVDDLLQEVLVRAHRGYDRLRRPESVGAWLRMIAHNAVVDHRRRQAAAPETVSLETVGDTVSGADTSTDGPRDVDRLARCVAGQIDTLPATYREAVHLVDAMGLPQREAAQRLEISLTALKSRVQRGRRILRRNLDDCCDLEIDARGRLTDCRGPRSDDARS